jgi:hypothetical protein|tara:strand:+ start:53 stop:1672 length:1620 start_codon:yes stop_codon:yes gene_type:complete
MAELFGYKISKSKEEEGGTSFTAPTSDDGAVDIAGGGFGASYLNTDGREKTDLDLIRRYRDIAQQSECDTAIEDIINEGIVANERDIAVQIVLDNIPYSSKIKKTITEEFDEVLRLLKFEQKGHDLFRRWYVDGRIYFHKIIDQKTPRKGITELRYIDATKIKKVRKIEKEKDVKTGVDKIKKVQEFFLYNEKGLGSTGASQGIQIHPDAITYVPSGVIDGNGGRVLSYLHKAIKPVNQLRMVEDSLVIYRISRAPERRIFYIDVGNLPKVKAEQYLKDVMNRYRNKLVYDATTGEVRDDRNHMSMLEDFWLPRREGGRGTEITTLPGGQNLGEIDDIVYFQRKLFRSLNVPISRLEAESQFTLGRSTEITRDELKFTKFVQRIRKKFVPLFTDILKTQLLLKGVISPDDWKNIQEHIQYDFLADGHFAELKEAELLNDRINTLNQVEAYIGTFFSKTWVQKNVLRLTEIEIEEMQKEINKESGMDPEDGGINLPDAHGGIRRDDTAQGKVGEPGDAEDSTTYNPQEQPPEEPQQEPQE